MKKRSLFISIFLASVVYPGLSVAGAYLINATTIRVFAQTTSEANQANMVWFSVPMYNGSTHPQCGSYAYILPEDKELFAKALTTEVTGVTRNVLYVDNADPKYIAGQNGGLTCKVVSIW